jgi:hypothetical protein
MDGEEPAKKIVSRMVEEIWSGGSMDLVDVLFPPDLDNGSGRPPGMAPPLPLTGEH